MIIVTLDVLDGIPMQVVVANRLDEARLLSFVIEAKQAFQRIDVMEEEE